MLLTILTHHCCRLVLIPDLSCGFLTVAPTRLPRLEMAVPLHQTVRIECAIGLFESLLIFDMMTGVVCCGVVVVVPCCCLLIVATLGLVAGEGRLQSDSGSASCVKTRTANILLLASDRCGSCLLVWRVR